MARSLLTIHVDTDMEMVMGMHTVMGMVTGAALQVMVKLGKDEELALQMVRLLTAVG